jgi:hypothetical protein
MLTIRLTIALTVCLAFPALAQQSGVCVAKDQAIQRFYVDGVLVHKLTPAESGAWRDVSNQQFEPDDPPGFTYVFLWKDTGRVVLVIGFDEHGWGAYAQRVPQELALPIVGAGA